MLAIPAIDLRDGLAVAIPADEASPKRVAVGDARDIARKWSALGFGRLHVADLDAAMGRGSNRTVVRDLLSDHAAPMQVGGGISKTQEVEDLLHEGAERVLVGTRAFEDLEWLAEIAEGNPGAVIVAADVRDRRVLTSEHASRGLKRNIIDLLDDFSGLPLGGILITAPLRKDKALGVDLKLMGEIAEASDWPVLAAGGISTIAELRALDDRGLAGAVIGRALYSGALDPRLVADEFAA